MMLVNRLRYAPAFIATLAVLLCGNGIVAQDAGPALGVSINGQQGEVTAAAGDSIELITTYNLPRKAQVWLVIAPVDASFESGFGVPIAIDRGLHQQPVEIIDLIALPPQLPELKVAMTAVALFDDDTFAVAEPLRLSVTGGSGN